MREIKFRAWDGKDMFDSSYGDWISFAGTPFTLANRTYNTPNTEIEPALNYTVMQYTGLKDKNGKEIYEGDIVTVMSWDTANFRNDNNRKLYYGEIQFKYSRWYSKPINYKNTNPVDDLEFDANKLEVIGNIYENPYLLEVKK